MRSEQYKRLWQRGRGDDLDHSVPRNNRSTAPGHGEVGTSVFDPVLCELLYAWFCPPAGMVLDPFAGGSVRGIVAVKMGLEYTGIDLRSEQIGANRDQAEAICPDHRPCWIVGDALKANELTRGVEADFLFSCPPYYNLEVYSDLPGELSALRTYEAFRDRYAAIIKECAALLKPNRFACFVVGEVRDRQGYYCGFVPDTVRAFQAAGLKYYNEIILVTAVGSLPVRVGRQFEAGRKIGKTHQNVLVFVKGDARRATDAIAGHRE